MFTNILFSNKKRTQMSIRMHLARIMQIIIVFVFLVSLIGVNTSPASADTVTSLNTAVLVNSASASYSDFQHYIQPYLDHFGVSYSVLDIVTTPVNVGIADNSLIIIGHQQLDTTGTYLDATEQGYISSAVNAGTGLVNFDNDLSANGSTSRYSFVQDVFGFGYGGATSGSGVSFPSGTIHYIAERHTPGESLGTGGMSLPGVTLPGDVTTVASTGTQPFIAVTTYGAGRAVQWGSYEWMSTSVRGPVYGLDDLVWRSLVWAARKPFVMQGMPPFLTMRSDDESGNFEWIHIANEFGIKPWAGLFYRNIDSAEAADLSNLTHAGLATASIHAFDGNFFYFNHGAGNYPDVTIAANFADGTAWHTTNNIPISDYVLPHYYEFGSNVFQGLSDWGVEFVGTQMEPGNGYGAPWIMNGPFREYETGGSSSATPMYYADFMTIPGHPEFDGKFFNCVTEVRDDAGYEWYPNLGDVAGTIGRGTRQTKRALDGMQLATLFTHGYYVSGSWGASAPANWRAILQGITNNLSDYEMEPVTMDYACRYIRATTTSNIASALFDANTNRVTANFSGVTDIPTRFFLFMEGEGYVMVDVPTFSGTATVNYTIPGPLHHIVVNPNPATIVAGTTQQFNAVGYDASDNPIPNLTFAWSVVNGGGTIDASGRFTAGVIPGTFANTVVATRNAISGTAGVTVAEPVLHHFEFATITSPKYLNAPFSVTLRARDDAGNLVVGYAGTASLTDSTGTVTPTSVGPFDSGVWTGPVAIGSAAGSVTLTATGSGVTGTSNAFQVLTAPVCPCSVWNSEITPANPLNADPDALEVGMKFQAVTDGYITALRFYRGAANTGTSFIGHLWTSSGAMLAQVSFPIGTPAGWQEVALPTPVPVAADTTYIASYYTSSGYAITRPYFTAANQALYTRLPLRALVDGEEGGNGVYAYGALGVFPNLTYQSTNYLVDVVFETEVIPDTTPPTVSSTIPLSGATGVSVSLDVEAVFSETMEAGTLNGTTFQLRDAANEIVAGSATYDADTQTATFAPYVALDYGRTYTAIVKGGIDGVADSAGNRMVDEYAWSFTTLTEAPRLDHFGFSAISSPQVAGTPIAVTITAYDAGNNVFTPYNGTANLSVSAGTITPVQTGSFVDGVWGGSLTIDSSVEFSSLVVTCTDGTVVGQSNAFALQLPPEPPDFYTVTSDSYQQVTGVPFDVTVTAYPGLTLNAWEDDHQYPVLATTTDPATLTPGSPGETDGQWTEFLYIQARPYPSVLAGVNEEGYGLPTMRFFADGIPNGEYQVIANLYDNAQMRYYYGYTPDNPKAYSIDIPGGATGTQHREYSLGNITITNGAFNIYVRDADWLGGQDYRFFGWAWIRLVPVYGDTTINAWEDNHQSPVLTTTTNPAAIVGTDGLWTEFLYTSSRPYPTILAGVNEENLGLPTLRIYADGIPNGTYQIFANLYDNASMRYYYGFSAGNPKEFSIDLPGGATGTQHREYSLGSVSITDGTFNIYIRDADWLGGIDYRFFGWAWIRLSSAGVEMSSNSGTMLFDADGDGIYGGAGDTVKQLTNGTFTISAQESTPGTGVEIIATGNAGRTGSNQYTVTATNQAPQAVGDTYTVDEGTTLTVAAPGVLTNDTDADSNPLTAIKVSDPTHGTLALQSNGSFTYTPTSGYTGDDTFTYKANDGLADSNVATVTVRVNSITPPPPLPSSFYGEVHIFDNPPQPGDKVEIFAPGVSGPVATATISLYGTILVYAVDVPGDIVGTPAKEGGAENDLLTFKINGRIVTTGRWHSGTSVPLNIHPPQALPGGPYTGTASAAISFSGSANDWGTDATTYQWDWDNDGTYDQTGQNLSHTFADYGTYTVGLKVTDSMGGEGTATTTVTVEKIIVTVTADSGQGKVYGQTDPVLTYTSSPSGVTFTGFLSREAGENVGTYAITQGSLSVGSNYTIVFVSADFTITPKEITVTADAKSKVYGAADPALTYSFTPALVGTDAFTGALSRAAGENVGEYDITQGTLALSSNYALTCVGAKFTITPKEITVTADAKSKVYGDADPVFTYTSSESVSFTGALTRVAGENVAEYDITQGNLSAGSNYTIVFVPADFSITPKEITVTAAAKSKVYGAADPALTYSFTPALVGTDAFTGALSRMAGENVDEYDITQGTLALSSNYTIVFVSADFTITSKEITVTADAKSKVYGAADPALTYSFTPALVDTDAFTGALTRAAGENVDEYDITQGTLALSSNYTIVFVSADFTITPKEITVTADAKSKVYGAADPALTYSSTPALVDTDAFTGALSRVAGENADEYDITQGTLALSSNYTLTYVGAKLTITPASATITLSNMTQVYDGTPKAATVTTNPAELSVSVTYNGSFTAPTAPGTYAVVATITDPNYSGTENGTFVIQAKHSIALVQGWNLVSFNVRPSNTAVAAVLSSLNGNYNLVYAWDATGARGASGNWMKYDPTGPSFQNSLHNLDETMGFWIYMTEPDTLDVIGSEPVTTAVNLLDNVGGWNLVSYASMSNRALPAALQSNGVGTDFSLVYSYRATDSGDPWKLFDRTGPAFANDLTTMSPGWGYWIKVDADRTWNVTYLPD